MRRTSVVIVEPRPPSRQRGVIVDVAPGLGLEASDG
jgi:hypothetical protein